MTSSDLSNIVIEQGPGELRAAALDQTGKAWHLFLSRDGPFAKPSPYGALNSGRVRALETDQGGAFLALDNGDEAFMRLTSRSTVTEGEKLLVRVDAEARHGKSARVQRVDASVTDAPVFEAWRDQLPDGESLAILEDTNAVDQAFDEALSAHQTLPGGGRPHARAFAINREAVEAALRQVLIKRLGGLVVMDCVAPISQETSAQLRRLMSDIAARFSTQTFRVEGPSRNLGVLAGSLSWRFQPMAEILLDARGTPTPETQLFDVLRQAVREARASAGRFFQIQLGAAPHAVYLSEKVFFDQVLPEDVIGRVQIAQSIADRTEVKRK